MTQRSANRLALNVPSEVRRCACSLQTWDAGLTPSKRRNFRAVEVTERAAGIEPEPLVALHR
jgi:hypothetical protein